MQVRLNCIRHKLGTNRGEFLWHTVDIRTRAERALVVSPHSRSGGNRAGAGLRRSNAKATYTVHQFPDILRIVWEIQIARGVFSANESSPGAR